MSKKYLEVYEHYKHLIEEGAINKGDKLPSLIAASKELGVSKTTAENAYFQLAADGYVISREKSGFYVTSKVHRSKSTNEIKNVISTTNAKYNLSTIGDDSSSFRFDLWQRYLKNAIRKTDRMVTYGASQGEYELRQEICEYVRKRRSIYCSPDSIVIGASTQSLLMILLPLLKTNGGVTASVPAKGFDRYAHIFRSHDINVDIRRKESDIIYVSPSHMTMWGEVMSIKRRYEILEHSRSGHLIIEDDYQNEFNFAKKVCPSIYSLAGGEHVVYIDSFSRLLLPSIRISFMIIPSDLLPLYKEVAEFYDQTASKTEQLALASYIRDGHLYRHIKKLRKTYANKRSVLSSILTKLTDNTTLKIMTGDCGTEMCIIGSDSDITSLQNRLKDIGITCQERQDNNNSILLFSCGIISSENLDELYQILKNGRKLI